MDDQGRQERAWCVVRIRGRLDPSWWSTWFGGFTIAPDPAGNTIVSGEVADQAAFFGLISRARDLGLTILSVERRDREGDSGK